MAGSSELPNAEMSIASVPLQNLAGSARGLSSISITSSIREDSEQTSVPSENGFIKHGSVDFIDSTDLALTNLTNPADVVGLSVSAPEIIASVDFVPLINSDDTQNNGIYNAIYQNVLLDSLTREAARNCLVKLLKNENGEGEQAVSSASTITVSSHEDLLTAFKACAAYSFAVRSVLQNNIGGGTMISSQKQIAGAFNAIRESLRLSTVFDGPLESKHIEDKLGDDQESTILNLQGFEFSIRDAYEVNNFYDIVTEWLRFSDDEFRNSSNTKLVAQVIQDLRRCIFYGSPALDLDDERDTSGAGFTPYEVFDDGPQGKFAAAIGGLSSLNESGDDINSVPVLTSESYNLFIDSIDDLDLIERMTILSQIASRDVSISFLKRTKYIIDIVNEFAETAVSSNPEALSIIDQVVGDIGGSLFSSSPGEESLASLLNPKTDDGERVLSFERFSVDSSFGDAIHGFGAFAGDFIHELREYAEAMIEGDTGRTPFGDLSYVDFIDDFREKAKLIARLTPVLIGGGTASNNFFRALCFTLAEYLEDHGFIHGNDALQGVLDGSISGTEFINAAVSSGEDLYLNDPADELEFIRFAIFVEAGKNSEIASLLLQFLDVRRLYMKQESLSEASVSAGADSTGVIDSSQAIEGSETSSLSDEDDAILAIKSSYMQFYDLAASLTQKILDSTNVTIDLSDTEPGRVSATKRRYVAKRTIDNITITSEEEGFSSVYNNPQDLTNIMQTPIGLALLTSPSSLSKDCIFDVPQQALDRFYQEFVENDTEGFDLQDSDITRIRRSLSDRVIISSSDTLATSSSDIEAEFGTGEIITDFRGYSDTMRRRLFAHMISDLLASIDVSVGSLMTQTQTDDLSVIPIEKKDESDTFQQVQGLSVNLGGPPPKADLFKAGGTTFVRQASFDAHFNTAFLLDTSRITQLAIACAKYSQGGLYSNISTSTSIETVESTVSTTLASVFGDEYDITIEENIRDINLALVEEYSRCEMMSETLVEIGNDLDTYKVDVNSFIGNAADHLDYLEYCALGANNAMSNEGLGITSEDAMSAILSTCMSPEALLVSTTSCRGVDAVSMGGFFDEDLSEDGKQTSATSLIIPTSEVIPASILSQRVIPGLSMMHAPGRTQLSDDHTKNDPIISKGDPDSDRMEILVVGIPYGLTEKLREEAENYSSYDGYEPEDYAKSPHISIKVYKKDLDRGDIVYKPKNFVFDSRLLSVARTDSAAQSVVSDLANDAFLNLSSEFTVSGDITAEDMAFGSHLPFRPGPSGDLSSPNEFNDLYTGVSFNAYHFGQIADENGIIFGEVGAEDLNDSSSSVLTDAADELRRNHLQDYILKEYLKITAGIDVREQAFPLFTKGCSYASSEDGGGLGTKSSDFTYLIDHSANEEFNFSKTNLRYQSDDYLNNARSDILSCIASGIENGAFGDVDLETSAAANVASKLKQSFLFSPEKYLNQVYCPNLFERVFCVLIDPDGFDLDYEEMSEETVSYLNTAQNLSESDGADYISEVFNFFATVEFLPIQNDLINFDYDD